MHRVIDEMAKAKADVERRYREKIPEIIRECMAFAYLGKSFTFDANAELEKRVNQRLVELSDEILEDIEKRAKRVIQYAEDEEDEPAILAYVKQEQNGEDLISRIDKHTSNFRYFLEGWMAIGIVNEISQASLLTNILAYIENPYACPLWQDAIKEGYRSNAIITRGYTFGKGNMRNAMKAHWALFMHTINTAYQIGKVLILDRKGAIGYRTHRASTYDCSLCDELTYKIHPISISVLPAHVGCVCYSTQVYGKDLSYDELRDFYNQNSLIVPDKKLPIGSIRRSKLSKQERARGKELRDIAYDRLKDKVVHNHLDVHFTKAALKEYINQPYKRIILKNEAAPVVDDLLQKATYLGINPKYNKKGLKHSHIYEGVLCGEKIWFVVREYNDGKIIFYSCSDSPEIAKGLIQK